MLGSSGLSRDRPTNFASKKQIKVYQCKSWRAIRLSFIYHAQLSFPLKSPVGIEKHSPIFNQGCWYRFPTKKLQIKLYRTLFSIFSSIFWIFSFVYLELYFFRIHRQPIYHPHVVRCICFFSAIMNWRFLFAGQSSQSGLPEQSPPK